MAPDEIEFGVDELFFSTTDAKGIIQKANQVFVRLSRHPWQELAGAPHNIIRNPGMPGGAFKAMWDTLQAGRPFCAYVRNQAADGAPYVVFATITPLGDGYLSVRSRPCATSLRDAAFAIYSTTSELEQGLRAEGASARDAARAGAEDIVRQLAELGFASFDDFVLTALPVEVEARAAESAGFQSRDGSGDLYDLLANVERIDGQLASWLAEQGRLASLANSLREATTRMEANLTESLETATRVLDRSGDSHAPVMLGVNLWASMMPEVRSTVEELAEQLTELAGSCAVTRFRIALASLHNDATAQFARELIDGVEAGQGSGRDAIVDLTTALDEGLTQAKEQSNATIELAGQVARQIEAVRDLLGVPQDLLANWQGQVDGAVDDALSDLLPVLAERLEEGATVASELTGLANRCRTDARVLDVETVQEALAEIRRLVSQVSGGQVSGEQVSDDQASNHEVPVARPRRGL